MTCCCCSYSATVCCCCSTKSAVVLLFLFEHLNTVQCLTFGFSNAHQSKHARAHARTCDRAGADASCDAGKAQPCGLAFALNAQGSKAKCESAYATLVSCIENAGCATDAVYKKQLDGNKKICDAMTGGLPPLPPPRHRIMAPQGPGCWRPAGRLSTLNATRASQLSTASLDRKPLMYASKYRVVQVAKRPCLPSPYRLEELPYHLERPCHLVDSPCHV